MAKSSSCRIGAVSYLNTKPLVYGLAERCRAAQLSFNLPSRLADQLSANELDVALIPVVEYLRDSSLKLVSDACIACKGPVWSVKLLSRVPLRDVKTLAVDEGSRTSVALASVLLRQKLRLTPKTVPLSINSNPEDISADAVLVIGDRAMHVDESQWTEVWDLGDQWLRWAELPFVFAVWAARANVETEEMEAAIIEARNEGVRSLDQIARFEAKKHHLSEEVCLSYLRDHLHFFLDSRCRLGLERFRVEAVAAGLAPAHRTLPWTKSMVTA